jgi:hypothetical protein
MVIKGTDYNGVATNVVSTIINRELSYQFLNVDTNAYFGYGVNGDPAGCWIQFQPVVHHIETVEFFSTQYRLLENRYVSLISHFNQESLELSSVKKVRVRASREFGDNTLENPDFASTTKQKSQKINSIFITFHPDEASKVIYIQPSLEKFRVNSEDAGNQTYPGCGLFMRT